MSRRINNIDAQDLATKALTFLGEQKLAPIPQNYAVAYCLLSGDRPDLNELIGQLIADGGVTTEDMLELYDAYFGNDENWRAIYSAGKRMQGIIAALTRALGAAGEETTNYGVVLADFAEKLDGKGAGELPQAVGFVLGETRKIETRNANIEAQFSSSSDEVAELRCDLDEMRVAARTDALTGTANRKHFDARIAEMVEHAATSGEPLTILMAGIDHFQRFKDNFGRQIGDHVLRLVSAGIVQSVRGEDFVARYGIEEFTMILPRTGLDGALSVAENIRAAIAARRMAHSSSGRSLGTITLSLGAAQYRLGDCAEDLVQRTEEGLFRAKQEGRNRVATAPSRGADLRSVPSSSS